MSSDIISENGVNVNGYERKNITEIRKDGAGRSARTCTELLVLYRVQRDIR